MQERLGVELDVLYCPHGRGPSGLLVPEAFARPRSRVHRASRLDPSRCVYVGGGPQDPGFARRFGFKYPYRDAADFFTAAKRNEVDEESI